MATTSPIPVASPEFAADLLALCDAGVKTNRLTRIARRTIASVLKGELIQAEAPVVTAKATQSKEVEWVRGKDAMAYFGLKTTRYLGTKAAAAGVRMRGRRSGRLYYVPDLIRFATPSEPEAASDGEGD